MPKNTLPSETFEHPFFPVPPALPSSFPIRPRFIRRLLKKLRLDQATGPDEISARFLRTLAEALGLPLAILCRRIFAEASWPALWRIHNLVPFKMGSVFLPTITEASISHAYYLGRGADDIPRVEGLR